MTVNLNKKLYLIIKDYHHYHTNNDQSGILCFNNGKFLWKSSDSLSSSESKEAFKKLKKIIGKNRFKRIAERAHLNFNPERGLHEKFVQKMFIALGDVRKDDLEEIAGKDLEACTTQELNGFYSRLLPTKQAKNLFFYSKPNVPIVDKDDYSAGKGFEGLKNRTWVSLSYHQKNTRREENFSHLKNQIEDTEFLAGRYIVREPPINSIVYLEKGYFYVAANFVSKGAYVTVFRPLDGSKNGIICCRGTCVGRLASSGYWSGINDMLPNIGSLGVHHVWKDVQNYLTENEIESVNIFGKSLGGGIAQYLTALIHTKMPNCRVKKLYTYCSVGVPKKVKRIYRSSSTTKPSPKIYAIRNFNDFVPWVGGRHLKNSSKSRQKDRVIYLIPHEKQDEIDTNRTFLTAQKISWAKKIARFLKSINNEHIYQASFDEDYIVHTITDKNKLKEEMKLGTRLEKTRKTVALPFNWLTLGLLNKSIKKLHKAA